jgi:hypothetical protein
MTVGLLRRGEFACTGSAVARFETATSGMWSCDEDGMYYTGGRGRRRRLCLFTPSSASGSLAWLVGDFSVLVHHLTQAFGKVPRHRLRGERLSFPCGIMFCQDCYIHVLYQ